MPLGMPLPNVTKADMASSVAATQPPTKAGRRIRRGGSAGRVAVAVFMLLVALVGDPVWASRHAKLKWPVFQGHLAARDWTTCR
jgi:hypothetical protein